MMRVLVGIDDTDNADSPGTGRLARELFQECAQRGLSPVGITRQQFLVDDRIPYTSHNSGACLVVDAHGGVGALGFVFDAVAGRAAEGSDAGVCVALLETLPKEVVAFGERATREVVEMSEALELARRAGIDLRGLGGTGGGVIGALGSVGLQGSGNHGRFIQLPGLRELPSRVGMGDLERLGIVLEHRGERRPGATDAYETLGWVRPRLQGGKPVLPITWSEERHAWHPVDRKRRQPLG